MPRLPGRLVGLPPTAKAGDVLCGPGGGRALKRGALKNSRSAPATGKRVPITARHADGGTVEIEMQVRCRGLADLLVTRLAGPLAVLMAYSLPRL